MRTLSTSFAAVLSLGRRTTVSSFLLPSVFRNHLWYRDRAHPNHRCTFPEVATTIQNATMPSRSNRKRPKNNKNNEPNNISIVGPDYIQILQGTLFNKEVSLVLCGESHQDSIDVTRQGGIFEGEEGWNDATRDKILAQLIPQQNFATLDDLLMIQVLSANEKSLSLQKAKDWAKQVVQDSDDGYFVTLVLLWAPDKGGGLDSIGKSYLIALSDKDEHDNNENDQDSEDEEGQWVNLSDPTNSLPLSVKEWVLNTGNAANMTISLEWGDLDAQAFALNQRRLGTPHEIPTHELDAIVDQRKERLQRVENIWTWDDWFNQQQWQYQDKKDGTSDIDVQLILEASVPPWELSLHRPLVNDYVELGPAAECIRCVGEDEEGDEEDYFDPSSDGIGSYLDYIYRRFMEAQFVQSPNYQETSVGGSDTTTIKSDNTWLHCVDMRDLGCQAACHADSVKRLWDQLLTPEEEKLLLGESNGSRGSEIGGKSGATNTFLKSEPDANGIFMTFVPECRMNPERLFLEALRSEGKLMLDDDDDDDDEQDENEEDVKEFTYPSFEGFFGQNTDFLYYSKHIKLSYSPFLAACVQSLEAWDDFFTNLFLGGSIPEALALLRLDTNKEYLYVRSPIHKLCNDIYRYRDDGEHYITYPFFPFMFYLFANGSSPPRTWSSNLFNKLCDCDNGESKQIAEAARDWTLQKIRYTTLDPKGADDPDSGGEWFEAYLYAAHREIYEDIDLSDTTALLKKNKMKSMTSKHKHNIGKIHIPNCKDGFEEILCAFASGSPTEQITPRSEVFAKILIDIYMSFLVDFATVLKITEIVNVSSKAKIVVVLYMGTAHTKAVSDFFVQRIGFKKTDSLGKVDYDEGECRTLKLPDSLWNFDELFRLY